MSDWPPVVGSPGPRRLPLTRTRVRLEFKPRRLTDAVPSAPFDAVEVWSANTCGNWLRRSSTRVTPVCWIASAETNVTGLMEVWLGTAMRDPVTTISSGPAVLVAAACAAGAVCAFATP